MSEQQYKELENIWDNTQDLNTKLEIIKQLFNADNLSDYVELDNDSIEELANEFISLQTIENIKVFDNFFTNTKFNNKYDALINNLKHFIYKNISNDVINKIKNTDDKQIINSYISAFASSHISYYLRNILINLDIDKRISTIDDNNITDMYLISDVIKQSNDQEKSKILEKFINKLDSYHIKNILESISDSSIKKSLIIKYINLCSESDQVKLISSFNNFNDIKDILEKCDDNTLGYVITDIGDDELKFNLTTIFLNRLDEYYLYQIIISVKDNNILNSLLEICINKLEGYSLFKIFDELYQRFNNADEKNDLEKINELSNILDNITDKYLDKFFDNDISNILSLYDYEGKVELIDKYINKINFSWDEIIGNCDTLDEKIQLFNRYSKYIDLNLLVKIIKKIEIIDEKLFFINSVLNILKSEDLCRIILDLEKIDEINKMISLYREKLREEDIVKIVCEKYSDSDKLEFLNKDISYTSKITIISSLKDENLKKEYLEDNIKRLNGFELATILQTLSSDDDKIKYLYQYEKIFDNDDLTKVVSSIKDFNKKIGLIEDYKDKLDIATVASVCNPDEALIIMKNYSVLFSPMQLSMYVNFKLKFYLNEEKGTEFLLVFFDLIPPNQFVAYLLPFFPLLISSDLKFYLIDANFQYIDDSDVRKVFYELSNSEKLKLLDKYIDIIDSKKMCLALSTFDLDDVLENIKKYESKINKEDIIYIILGQISNLINNNQEINQDKLANIYSLIIDGKIDKNKCLDIINNLASLDIYSISAIDYYLLNNEFKDFINFDSFISIISKLSKSNSTEIQHLTPNLVNLLIGKEKSNQDKIINELEQVFLKNNLPMMAKIYKVFDIMHPNFGEFNGYSYQSPNLNARNNPLYKQIILFADLMKITVGSNNRLLKEYVKHIEIGNNIVKEIITNNIDIDSIDDNYKEILVNYLNHLKTLYNNTLYGKNNPVNLSGNIKKDILMFISLFGKNEQDFDINKLPDRIVKMFAHFAGIDTMGELKKLMDTTIKTADQRNRDRAKLGKFEIHKGYFVKGIANQDKEDEFYTFLTNIFQNGSLCKELLGDAARSDTTPMDTDVSRMLEEPTSFEDAFTNPKYASSRYGPIWIVLKDDDRFNETNDTNNKYIPGKLEVFETSMDGQGHYGIRTGFASSDIDYLVVDESRVKMDRIKYEIVMNGFYIPLVNTKGNLVFTPKEYDELHEKMVGLSYYNTESEYKFALELDSFDINNTGYNIDIVKSINEVAKVREEVISKLRETGLDIKLGRSLDLKDKCIDLIDTGSTSRGTNKMDGYDFDFVMRVDKEIYTSDERMNELYQSFKNVFPDIDISGHKIRKYKLKLENGKEVELDITFIMKTNKMDYSTEECLQDRLNTIKNMDEKKYKKVLENIVLAKYVLSSIYKSKNAAENPQGGLGGVGIENWILQNGGSFESAARSFLEKAEGRSFREFIKEYTIWDFGQNNLSFKRDDGYTHDEFVKNNMSEDGYNKIVSVLKEYINTLEHSKQL